MAKIDLEKAKGILSYIGFDDSTIESLPEETFLDDAKKTFDGKYHTEETFFKSEPYKKQVGKINGVQIGALKKLAKKYGVDLEGDDLKDNNPEIAFEVSLTKLQSLNNAAMEELKKQAENSKDDNFKKLETKFNSKLKDYEQIENLYKEAKATNETQKSDFDKQLKTHKLDYNKKALFNKIEWGVEPGFMRKGFLADYNERFDHEFDDNENLIPIDKKTGEKIPNPDKSKTFMDAGAHLEKEAIAAKVWKMNPKGGDPAPRTTPYQRTPAPAAAAPGVRTAGTPALAINTYSNFPGSNGQ